MSFDIQKVFSIFGHRPEDLGGYDEKSAINNWVKFSLKAVISHLVNVHKNVLFLCGSQVGTEMWAAEEVLLHRDGHAEKSVKMEIVLPYECFTGRNKEGLSIVSKPWPEESHKRFMSICSRADATTTLSKDVAPQGDAKILALKKRDTYVIDNSIGMIVVLKSECKAGPLFNAIKYAESKCVQTCIIDPTTESIYTGYEQ